MTLAYHTRIQGEEDLPHATKEYAVISYDTRRDALNEKKGQWRITSASMRVCALVQIAPAEAVLHGTARFTLTPQRMRMIVEAFKETLELGLEKPGQTVVRTSRNALSASMGQRDLAVFPR